ncbi:unnamed protein product [Rotaria sp. Silwood1]|nr:unnamed protein product [Rotaria sp. Silwood1]CAF1479759.1 unnamed protein product [Rotaria sp. Silwood1]CAF3686874.1 unnamed protein product [Rotaria sp. Silwood1]CAF3719128.1 unnamed protein product [Rotaria sp. Silwood1]CAF4871112.1 unnamed protein product [Rotaria sp. Silwood1]
MKMLLISLIIYFIFYPNIIKSSPSVTSRYKITGYHTWLEYQIHPDIQQPIKCLFVWHRLPPYLYIEPEELNKLNATIIGKIDIEKSSSESHPFAYCFILYNSSKIEYQHSKTFSINIHNRYIDPISNDNQQYETVYLPEPVIHFTDKTCPYLGSGCPPPLTETAIESPRQLTVTIPLGQKKHLWFVYPLTCLFPIIASSLLFIFTQ